MFSEPGRQARAVLLGLLMVGLLGMALRFSGYATRLFWTDEAITMLRTGGHTDHELTSRYVDGNPHAVGGLLQFVQDRSALDTRSVVRSLAVEDAQHPPAYYVLAAWWTRVFGASISALRLLSVLIGCCVPPAIGWLCFELFGTRMAAACGFAVAAVSPILVIYSQQAREYGLWALFIAVSSALLLRAVRAGGWWWAGYAVAILAGTYTDTLFATLLASHVVYGALTLRGRQLVWFSVCIAATVLLFLPWFAQILIHRRAIDLSNAWTATPWPLHMLVAKWLFNGGATFFDLEYAHALYGVVLLPICAVVVAALWWVATATTPRARMFTLSLLIVPLFLFVMDVVLHQHRSTVTRYGMQIWVALIVVVAGFLGTRMSGVRAGRWIAVTAFLLVAMLLSSAVDVQARTWWDNRGDAQNLPLAARINEPASALVVASGSWARILALAFYLRPQVELQLIPLHTSTRPASGFDVAYLLGRPQDETVFARDGAHLRLVYRSTESNQQVRNFRGTDNGREYLSLWAFADYGSIK